MEVQMYDLIARPDEKLYDHLIAVGERGYEIAPDVHKQTPLPIPDIVLICGYLHDLGKAIPQTQSYLKDERGRGDDTNHSYLGGLAAVYLLDHIYGVDAEITAICYTAITKHHSNLPDVSEWVENGISATGTDIESQIQSVAQTDVNRQFIEQLLNETSAKIANFTGEDFIEIQVNDFISYIDNSISESDSSSEGVDATLKTLLSNNFRIKNIDSSVLVQVYSALILADRSVSAGIEKEDMQPNMDPFTSNKVHDYINTIQSNSSDPDRMNELRDLSRESVVSNITDFADKTGKSVASLTLPTGFGKTITSIEAAIELSESKSSNGNDSRIIYSLPFTSIIDQTASVLQNVFDTDDGTPIQYDSRSLTLDHHLQKTVTNVTTDSETDSYTQPEYLLGKTWSSGMVLTTFVQLFESLFVPSPSQSMKLPNLQNSVIILDEPQSIPESHWNIIELVIDVLIEYYNASIIFMTATQPKLLDVVNSDIETVELVDDDIKSECYNYVDRVEFHLDDSIPQSYSINRTTHEPRDHISAGIKVANNSNTGSQLAICNTKSSARELYKTTNKRVETIDINYLSSRIDIAIDELELSISADVLTALYIHTQRSEQTNIQLNEDILDTVDVKITKNATPIACLTTQHRPKNRLTTIKIIQLLHDPHEMENKLRNTDTDPLKTDAQNDHLNINKINTIVTTTQLVEAGVDFSFDHVYRDLSPLENIIQASGRCNRSYESDTGTVTIWQLQSPNKKSNTDTERKVLPTNTIYSAAEIDRTVDVLATLSTENGRKIAESKITNEAIISYMNKRVDEGSKNANDGNTYVNAYNGRKTDLGKIDSNWNFINSPYEREIYIPITETEKSQMEKFMSEIEAHNWKLVSQLKRELEQIKVQVKIYDTTEEHWSIHIPPLNTDIYGDQKRILKVNTDNGIDTTSHYSEKFGIVDDYSVEDRFY